MYGINRPLSKKEVHYAANRFEKISGEGYSHFDLPNGVKIANKRVQKDGTTIF